MCSHTSGSTNSRQRTAPSTTLDYEIPLPTDKEILNFCSIVTPMYETITRNICENQDLAKLRDHLLPMLMSGAIDLTTIDL